MTPLAIAFGKRRAFCLRLNLPSLLCNVEACNVVLVYASTSNEDISKGRGRWRRQSRYTGYSQLCRLAALTARLHPARPSAKAMADVIGELKKLSDMKTAGLLTDEEFTTAKAKILGNPTAVAAELSIDRAAAGKSRPIVGRRRRWRRWRRQTWSR